MSFLTEALENTTIFGYFLGLSILVLFHLIHRAIFDPLSQIPGPFLAKFSSLWVVLQCRQAKRSISILGQHQMHGEFVRIAPNHISISNKPALEIIYGHNPSTQKAISKCCFFCQESQRI
ncbi:hypothetical protein N7540_002243 [Penicillium herquei]|nr:hypothetical protein N7540_002243 [Penicillium herquei]